MRVNCAVGTRGGASPLNPKAVEDNQMTHFSKGGPRSEDPLQAENG